MEKQIKNFEDYIINDSGINDKSVWSTKSKKFMKSKRTPKDYIQICFTVKGKHHQRYLHVLLAEAFIPNPEGKPTVNHKNHKRDDNRLENLEWATYPEQCDEIMRKNVSKARKGQHNSVETEFKKGDIPWNKGLQTPDATKQKISDKNSKQVFQSTSDGELVGVYKNSIIAAKETGFSRDLILKACSKKIPHYKNFIWDNKK